MEDLCKADIVLVPAGLIEEESGKRRPYTELLARKAGTGAVPPAPASESCGLCSRFVSLLSLSTSDVLSLLKNARLFAARSSDDRRNVGP